MGKIGVIGGSGLYDMEELTQVERVTVQTPFGEASDQFILGDLENKQIVFLPRHGQEHKILPTELNYRANIYGMKKLGVEKIISVSAVGSLREELKPQDFVLVDQFVDRTNQARRSTFFGEGIVAHVSFAEPTCSALRGQLLLACKSLSINTHPQGTYLNMEGPAFSTRAESNLYRSWGMDVIGMTNLAEARLAKEAEICYATVAMITDYDCWRPGEEGVNMDLIMQNMRANIANAKKMIRATVAGIDQDRTCSCVNALECAIVTAPEAIDQNTKQKLDIIIGKYLK